MLLRRITQHVKDQNWFAVLIDFVIVVFGVFIGIQVANWNDARADRQKEVEFFDHVLENLNSDLAEYDSTLTVSEWRMSAINQINREITGEDIPHVLVFPINDDDTIKPTPEYDFGTAAPTAIGFFASFEGHRSAFDALISTGDIRIIRNKNLLKDLQEYYVRMDSTDEMEKRLTVFRDQLHEQRSLAGVASTDQMTIEELSEIVGEHPALFSSLKSFWHFSEFHRRSVIRERLAAEALIARIESGDK